MPLCIVYHRMLDKIVILGIISPRLLQRCSGTVPYEFFPRVSTVR